MKMNSIENQQIMQGIVQGDITILKDFYRRNLPYVRAHILQNNGITEDVEDIFQDSLLLLYAKLRREPLALDVSIHTYFIAICKNKWRNQLRRQYKMCYNSELLVAQEAHTKSIVDVMLHKDQEYIYHKHLAMLNEDNRNLLALFFEGKSMREIARIIGHSEGYTRKKKFEIKEYLCKMIQKEAVYKELVVV